MQNNSCVHFQLCTHGDIKVLLVVVNTKAFSFSFLTETDHPTLPSLPAQPRGCICPSHTIPARVGSMTPLSPQYLEYLLMLCPLGKAPSSHSVF